MSKTKIIATIGPVTFEAAQMQRLIRNGANIARFNFSHGTFDWFHKAFEHVHTASKKTNKAFPILLDTKGPEIRTGDTEKAITIKRGKEYTISYEGDKLDTDIKVSYPYISLHVKKRQLIQVDSGLLPMKVTNIEGKVVHAKALANGDITSRRHVNLPGVRLDLPTLSEKDKADIEFGVAEGIHMIAASFVNNAEDILLIRKEIGRHTDKHIPIIAKIETAYAVQNLEEIVQVSDGIMVARGDLGVEVPIHDMPLVQRKIVHTCRNYGVPVIIATQMLKSMVDSPIPTRAEISDIGFAIFSGADAIMLSDETTVGAYPDACVAIMKDVAKETEKGYSRNMPVHKVSKGQEKIQPQLSLIETGVDFAEKAKANAVVLVTNNFTLARRLAARRTKLRTIICTSDIYLYNYCSLLFGVRAHLVSNSQELRLESHMESMDAYLESLVEYKYLKKQDTILTFFDFIDSDGNIDTMQIRKID